MLTEEEQKMVDEMEALIAEMKKHPEIMNAPFPESMDTEIWRDIHEYEAEQKR